MTILIDTENKKARLHENIKTLIDGSIKYSDSNTAFFCKNRMIAEIFTNYVYFAHGINLFLDSDDCMCYAIYEEDAFFITDDKHKRYRLVNVYLED